MLLVLCRDPLEPARPNRAFEAEAAAIEWLGLAYVLVDHDAVDRLLAEPAVDLPVAFVLDAGVIRGVGAAVVEANQASGAGIYGCDPSDVPEVLRAATIANSRTSGAD
jgi:hypothetical protein